MYVPPAPERMAGVASVVIGKISDIEKKSVRAPSVRGGTDLVEYQIAVIKVDDAAGTAAGLTHVRVGLLSAEPAAGVEGCFFLTPHPTQPFYVLDQGFPNFITKASDPNGLATAKRCCKLLKDPLASLKAKEADDRYLTAAMLVIRYRGVNNDGLPRKAEPIPAEESKLILQVLRDADWNRNAGDRMNPQYTFSMLGLTPQDGWQPPQDFTKFHATAKGWLAKHADTYRIQRLVPHPK
jgi:hypothetical protein